MNIVSLFSGAGGMDLGFKKAGFNIIWANEFDESIHETYIKNHRNTALNKNDIRNIAIDDIPDCIGIIGGPPCQSWSIGGNQKGLDDERGKLFWEFIRIVQGKRPLFFVAENVKGLISEKHKGCYQEILRRLTEAGYRINSFLLNAADYQVPQNRERVFILGFRVESKINLQIPEKSLVRLTLYDSIGDLQNTAIPAISKYYTNGSKCILPNHEYLDLPFPLDYANSNKVKPWHDQSFTIRATGKYALPHPSCPNMKRNELEKFSFPADEQAKCRRMSVRECARIQTFPDNYIFYYKNLMDGYKMVGNAVPVELSYVIAKSIIDKL